MHLRLKFFLYTQIFLFFFCSTELFSSKGKQKKWKLKDMVVFGDSLSDQGNLFTFLSFFPLLRNVKLESPPAGHNGMAFCNGKLTVEYIAEMHQISLKSAWKRPLFFSSSQIEFKEKSDKEKAMLLHGYEQILPPFSHYNKLQISQNSKTLSMNELQKLSQNSLKTLRRMKSFLKPQGNNYSVAGATILQYSGIKNYFLNQFCLDRQVGDFIDLTSHNSAQTLFVICIGGNDILKFVKDFESGELTRDDAMEKCHEMAKNVIHNVKKLILFGAKKVLILPSLLSKSLPHVHSLPKHVASFAEEISQEYESALKQNIKDALLKETSVRMLSMLKSIADIEAMWDSKYFHSAPLHFKFSFENILETIATRKIKVHFNKGFNQEGFDSDLYPFFDKIHPSSATNRMLATMIESEIDYFLSL